MPNATYIANHDDVHCGFYYFVGWDHGSGRVGAFATSPPRTTYCQAGRTKTAHLQQKFCSKIEKCFCALGSKDRLIIPPKYSKPHSLGEADVGADGVFVPALSGVEPGRVALVARGVLCRKEPTTIDV